MNTGVTVTFERPDANRLVARLREGQIETDATGWNPEQSAAHLLAALDAARADGHGECFWPEPTGHYWWMFSRVDDRLEVAVLWSRSSAVGWQHVFRATDEITYVRDLVRSGLARVGFSTSAK
jgi:hypothetical protein